MRSRVVLKGDSRLAGNCAESMMQVGEGRISGILSNAGALHNCFYDAQLGNGVYLVHR